MKKANKKQSLYINRLSYILYKLCDCENKKIIIFPDEAKQLPADMAGDMIKELKQKIYNKEIEKYIYPFLFKMDQLKDIKPILVPEYKKIDKIKPSDNVLYVITVDGQEYKINSNTRLILNKNNNTTIRDIYDALVQAINFNLGVRIYISDEVISLGVEDQNNDHYIKLINEIIEIMGNKMPIGWDGKYTPEHLIKINFYLQMRDTDVALKFKSVMENNQEAKKFCSLLKAGNEHLYGLTTEF